MDKETRDAFSTLAAGLALIAERQRRQGEMLAEAVKLLTPPEQAEPSPVVVLLEQVVAMLGQMPAATARAVEEAWQRAGRP